MDNAGHVKIHRKVLNSAIWQNVNDWRVAETLLLMANWKGAEFQPRCGNLLTINRGEVVTSLKTLEKKSRLTIQNIRTSLSRLEKCNFLTSKSTNHYRIIKILKYSQYQDRQDSANSQSNNVLTGTQQPPNNDRRRSKKVKKTDNNALEPKIRKESGWNRFMNSFLVDYCKIKPGDPDPGERAKVKAAYETHGKLGRNAFNAAGMDADLAIRGLHAIGMRMERDGLNWGLSAVAKHMADFMADPKDYENETKNRR